MIDQTEDKYPKLTPHEQRALEGFRRDPHAHPIAPDTAGKMLRLYLQGYSCHDIRDHEAFRGFTVGAIVNARVSGRWDEAREEVRERVRRSIMDQSVRVAEETSRVIYDLLMCANIHLARKCKDYLTGASETLPLEVASVQHYRQLVGLFQGTLVEPPGPGKDPPKPVPDPTDDDDITKLPRSEQLRVLAEQQRRLAPAPPAEA